MMTVRGKHTLESLLVGLPPEADEEALIPTIGKIHEDGKRPLVVIDDDPTGCQTVYDCPFYLDWGFGDLQASLHNGNRPVFFLTNSRSLQESQAMEVNERLGRTLAAFRSRPPFVISRSDSTLRGHFPQEVLALAKGLGEPFDGILLVPAFFEAGRYTIGDIHWVASQDDGAVTLLPAHETAYSRDPTFGYSTSHLPTWVEQRSRGRWSANEVGSVSIQVVREGSEAVCQALAAVNGGVPVVVNVSGYGDLATFVLGLLQAEELGKRFLYRTAASFVRVRAGLPSRPLLEVGEIYAQCSDPGSPSASAWPGLVIVGSHIAVAREQLSRLLEAPDLPTESVEVPADSIFGGTWHPQEAATQIEEALLGGRLPVVHTSGSLVHVEGQSALDVGRRVMAKLVDTVARVHVRPRFIVVKGGITSHEIARFGIKASKGRILGQLLPGVPVWRIDDPGEARSSGMPYVVFPGNVGTPGDLLNAVRTMSRIPGPNNKVHSHRPSGSR